MTIPGLSEGFIRQQATVESFRRGQDYRRREAVISLVQGDDTLEAQIHSSSHEPYQVCITFDWRGGCVWSGIDSGMMVIGRK